MTVLYIKRTLTRSQTVKLRWCPFSSVLHVSDRLELHNNNLASRTLHSGLSELDLTWLMSSGVLELSWLSRSSCPSLQSWVLCFPFLFLVLECPSSWGLVFLAFAYHVLESSEVVWRLVPVDFWNNGLRISIFSAWSYQRALVVHHRAPC